MLYLKENVVYMDIKKEVEKPKVKRHNKIKHLINVVYNDFELTTLY